MLGAMRRCCKFFQETYIEFSSETLLYQFYLGKSLQIGMDQTQTLSEFFAAMFRYDPNNSFNRCMWIFKMCDQTAIHWCDQQFHTTNNFHWPSRTPQKQHSSWTDFTLLVHWDDLAEDFIMLWNQLKNDIQTQTNSWNWLCRICTTVSWRPSWRKIKQITCKWRGAQHEMFVRHLERRQHTVCAQVAMWHCGIDTIIVDTHTTHRIKKPLMSLSFDFDVNRTLRRNTIFHWSQGALSVEPCPIHQQTTSSTSKKASKVLGKDEEKMGPSQGKSMLVNVNGVQCLFLWGLFLGGEGSLQILEVDCASCELGVVRTVVVFGHHCGFLNANKTNTAL